MMIGVGGNTLIFRLHFREFKEDLNIKMTDLKSDLDELSTDLKELMKGYRTDTRTLCDSTLADADLKNANSVKSRREGS